ncbi:MAG: putative PEP-binding protein [bacterium]|nr:putative PEP-binding protein [bacterium]
MRINGLVYSRNPFTGERNLYGEFRTKNKKEFLLSKLDTKDRLTLEKNIRELEKKLKFPVKAALTIHNHSVILRNVEKITISVHLHPKMLLHLLDDKIISELELFDSFPLREVNEWLSERIEPRSTDNIIATCEKITIGAATGILTQNRDDVIKWTSLGKKIIWLIDRITAEDVFYFKKVEGLIFTSAGPSSHGAIIAKSLGKPVIFCPGNLSQSKFLGTAITLDANNGKIYEGSIPIIRQTNMKEIKRLVAIAKRISQVKVAANADTVEDAKRANKYFAEGIGVCRTEHMFFHEDREKIIRQILFTQHISKDSLLKLSTVQSDDFFNLFSEELEKTVVVRLLDAPLHEFIPKEEKAIEELALELGVSKSQVIENIREFHEENPMLGYRGIRLLLKRPQIINVQIMAICNAIRRVKQKFNGRSPNIIIELPMVIDAKEVKAAKYIIEHKVKTYDHSFRYKIGAMIETPRACILIKDIAREVDFISFGTNDLTQTCLAISRDDTAQFMEFYSLNNLFVCNPFITIDEKGVGRLMKETIIKAKHANPKIVIGICGEHGGDPDSIRFFIRAGIDEISCNPTKVPLAILVSAVYSNKKMKR